MPRAVATSNNDDDHSAAASAKSGSAYINAFALARPLPITVTGFPSTTAMMGGPESGEPTLASSSALGLPAMRRCWLR